MANFFGIDFGTTNSAVVAIAAINGEMVGEPTNIGNEGSRRYPMPSYVAIDRETGEVFTGLQAKKSIVNYKKYQVFKSIKSVIDEDKTWEIAGKTWTQIDIATELFKALKENVIQRSDGQMDLDTAVVAVPAEFSPKKKNNVRKAAKKAGIKVSMFISEPTSAYCSKLDEMKKYKNVAVFDWGGGTLDVAVLHIQGNMVSELAKRQWTFAGDDIDKKIAEKICLKVAKKKNIDISFDYLSEESRMNLMAVCEEGKCEFSDEEKVSFYSPEGIEELGMFNEVMDYDFFSLLIENDVDKAVDTLREALSDAGMNRESIDCIICEGGSSRLRPLQTRLLEYFDREKLIFPRTAMWDIAAGAAQIAFKPGCYTLSRPIGIIQSNNRFYPLLKVGQRVPTEEKEIKFGVIESTDEARFVLSDGEEGSQTFSEYFPVKLRGFSDEILHVSCYVDADMIFRMKIRSNRMPDDVFRVWTYSTLKVAYEMNPPEPELNEEGEEE